jgi:hypothetical protein
MLLMLLLIVLWAGRLPLGQLLVRREGFVLLLMLLLLMLLLLMLLMGWPQLTLLLLALEFLHTHKYSLQYHAATCIAAELDPVPYAFGPPGSGSISTRYGSGPGSGSFFHQAKVVKASNFLLPSWRALMKIAGSGVGSESVSQKVRIRIHGSAMLAKRQKEICPLKVLFSLFSATLGSRGRVL